MFLLSKAVLLTAFLVGSTGVSTYLIPLYLKNPKLNSLFLKDKSPYNKENTENFRKKEEERLKKLNNLFTEISEAFKKAIEFKDLLNKEMDNLFGFITSSESKLSASLVEHAKKLDQLSKTFEKLTENYLEKTKAEAELEKVKHSKKVLSELQEKFLNAWEKHFQEFIQVIDDSEKNQEQSNSQGGAVPELLAKKLSKH